ncbi:cytochrome P450 2J2 [Columba guinea]|nr:cytochrome P450 2J2 [Columba guinea]
MLRFLWESISCQTLLIFLIVFLLIADYMKHRKPKDFPPQPFYLPILGHMYLMNFSNPMMTVQKCGEGVNPKPMAHEDSQELTPGWAGRLPSVSSNVDEGLLSSNGHLWKQQRRFTLSTLRNFGLGKRSLEERIQEECRYLVDAFGDEQGSPFDPHFKINNAVSNIICSITFGNRFDYHDEDFQKLLRLLDETVGLHGAIMSQLYNAFPSIIKFLPGPHQTIFKNWRLMRNFVKERVDKHKEDWNPSESRDFIDCYLQEIAKDKGDVAFQEENLVACVLDLFLAGTETTSTTIRWALLFMAMYPEIQARVQAEIDTVIGQARQPALDDRSNMPYTNAVIHEVQRKGNIAPFILPRLTMKDTVVDGFRIPKGTGLIANLNSMMFDKNEWETPDTFNPGHFLKDGQFWKRESFLPFSIGKRSCPGELLARTELFLFFTALLQKFTFQAPPDTTLSLQFKLGITLSPKPYKICAVPR